VAGSLPGGPSWAYRLLSWLVESLVPFGSNGPLTDEKTGFLASWLSAWLAGVRSFHTDVRKTISTWVGLATDSG